MAKNDFENGIWRTIGGRRIFIKDSESLATAMKKSGKFKNNINEKIKDDVLVIKHTDEEINDMRKEKNKEILNKDLGYNKIYDDKNYEYGIISYETFGKMKNFLKMRNKHTGDYESQIDFYYDDKNDLVSIELLHTNSDFRRKGNATKIMNVLQNQIAGKDNEMYLGALETDGQKFVESKMEITKEEKNKSKSMVYWGKMK